MYSIQWQLQIQETLKNWFESKQINVISLLKSIDALSHFPEFWKQVIMQSMEVVIRNSQIISFDKNDLCLCYIKLFGILLFLLKCACSKNFFWSSMLSNCIIETGFYHHMSVIYLSLHGYNTTNFWYNNLEICTVLVHADFTTTKQIWYLV